MNTPQGFELDAAGKVVDTAPFEVLFSPAWVYEVPHMILAAYMVAGFLFASVYAVGMLQGPARPPPPARAVDPADDRLRRRRRCRSSSATRRRAKSPTTSRPSSPASSASRRPGPNQTEYLGGICTDDGVKGAIGIPGLDSLLVGFSTDTVVTGLEDIPPDERPPANTLLHLAFDAMVGIGFALLALAAWLAFAWWRRRDLPRTPGSCARSRSPARRRSSACGAAGSSPRSAASPGSCRATCAPAKR